VDVPKAKPEGIEVLVTDGGARFFYSTPRFWSKLPPKRSSFFVNKHGLIWIYQVCAKALRAPNVNEGFDELRYDLQSALAASEFNIANRVAMNDEVLGQVADMLHKKGWVKV
jgi:hypothetical protein